MCVVYPFPGIPGKEGAWAGLQAYYGIRGNNRGNNKHVQLHSTFQARFVLVSSSAQGSPSDLYGHVFLRSSCAAFSSKPSLILLPVKRRD